MKIVKVYLITIVLSALKFVPGSLYAFFVAKMSLWEMLLIPSLSGILGVVFFTFFGAQIRVWIDRWRGGKRKNRINIARARKWYRFWKRFGIYGVAILTPPFLSPPGGVALSLLFREKRSRIILYMSVSFLIWGIIFTLLLENGFTFFVDWFGGKPAE